MNFKRGRYSWLIRPFLVIYDVFILNIFAYYLLDFNYSSLYFFSSETLNNKYLLFVVYSTILWLVSTFFTKFYKVYRYTSLLNIFSLLFRQYLVFTIITYAFIGVFRSINISAFETLKYLLYSFLAIAVIKLLSFYALRTFRLYLKGNTRNVIIVGCNESAMSLRKMFTDKKDLGYVLKAVFCDSDKSDGTIEESFEYLKSNEQNIDEIYCSIDELSQKQVNKFVQFANINHSNIKFIPNKTEQIVTKRLKADYYGYLTVLSVQEVALNDDFNWILKRIFDILFSIMIIVFVLSWLSIILFVLIKLESKGSLFFKQKRNGINYKEFDCYKFRSLKTNPESNSGYVKKDDMRVTKIGKFMRKTSIDEFPQFFNVLRGDMSVVGPRPHMLSYTDAYSKKVDIYNFLFRHHVKPGITGLAQIKGYRGEVKTDKDIIGRVKYDIFYIENWSLLLDLKIIFQTFLNAVKGDDKAY